MQHVHENEEGIKSNSELPIVEKYETLSLDGYTINVWDSPGLFDGSDRKSIYVESMKKECGDKIDVHAPLLH